MRESPFFPPRAIVDEHGQGQSHGVIGEARSPAGSDSPLPLLPVWRGHGVRGHAHHKLSAVGPVSQWRRRFPGGLHIGDTGTHQPLDTSQSPSRSRYQSLTRGILTQGVLGRSLRPTDDLPEIGHIGIGHGLSQL